MSIYDPEDQEVIRDLRSENAALRAQVDQGKRLLLLCAKAARGMKITEDERDEAASVLEPLTRQVEELKRERDRAEQGLKITSETARQDLERAERAEKQLAEWRRRAWSACEKPCSCGLPDWPCHVDGDLACEIALSLARAEAPEKACAHGSSGPCSVCGDQE